MNCRDLGSYLELYRQRAGGARSEAVRMSLRELCACIEGRWGASVRGNEVLPELCDLERLLDACDTDTPEQSACDAFFAKAEQAISHCSQI
jgi:hypothetical protein